MFEPKVSVVLPVYNVAAYLPKCLESLLNQTLKEIEIICVNDCSPDNSLEILKQYAAKDNRIKIIDQTNTGPGVARNNGIKAATGEYVGFVDPDDWAEPEMFAKMYTAAIEQNADIVECGVKIYNEKSGKTKEKQGFAAVAANKYLKVLHQGGTNSAAAHFCLKTIFIIQTVAPPKIIISPSRQG